jgi:hypothetical protein
MINPIQLHDIAFAQSVKGMNAEGARTSRCVADRRPWRRPGPARPAASNLTGKDQADSRVCRRAPHVVVSANLALLAIPSLPK